MANYSKFLSLISGADRTVDLSLASNTLELGGGGLQMDGSTSGHVVINASAVTTTYSLVWPAGQAANSGYVLTNDGTGILSWAPAASPLTFSDSLVNNSGTVTLVNDSASPTASQYYGTNGSSALGYYNLPVSGINQLTGDVTAGPGTGSQVASLVATSNSTLVTLSALSLPTSQLSGYIDLTSQVSGILPIANGGTGQTSAATAFASLSPLTTSGDIIYENASPAPARLAIGTTGQVLTVVSGLPAWATATVGANTSLSNLTTTSINQNLIPNSTSLVLGSSSDYWSTLWAKEVVYPSYMDIRLDEMKIYNNTGSPAVDVGNTQLNDNSSELSIDWTNRELCDSSGNTQFFWSTNGVQAGVPNTLSGVFALASGSANALTTISARTTATSYNFNLPTTAGTSGQVLLSGGGSSSPMTWSTDIAGNAANITATSNSTLTTLSALSLPGSQVNGNISGSAANVTGTVAIANGGTGATTAADAFAALSPMTTAGDILYENTGPVAARLPIGSNDQILTVVSGLPAWADPASAGVVTSVTLTDDSTTPIYGTSSSLTDGVAALTLTLETQSANTVLAGPTTGSAAQPAFRSLVAADIPDLSATYILDSRIGADNGVASLDASGRIPSAQLPSTVLQYEGLWYPAATFASYNGTITGTSTAVVLTAVTAGTGGNSIDLAFNGATSINSEITVWNTANPSNEVALTSGDGTQIPSNGASAQLAGGVAANTPYLQDSNGTNGYVYQVADNYNGTISGLNNSTMTNFLIGNLIIYSGALSQWEQTTPAAGVSSVNGAQGAVTVNAINQLTGDVTSAMASGSESEATTVAKIQGQTVSGTTGTGNVVFSASPTLTGTAAFAAITASSTIAATGAVSGSNLTSGGHASADLQASNNLSDVSNPATAFNNISPMTTTGDMEYESSPGNAARLPIGSTGQVLTVVSGVPAWETTVVGGVIESIPAGQSFTANTLYAVRFSKSADSGFVAGQVVAADNNTSPGDGSEDNFYVIGLIYPSSSIAQGTDVSVVKLGIINVPGHGFTVGQPLFLGSSGAITETPPSTEYLAVERVGIVRDANNIEVQIAQIGVN